MRKCIKYGGIVDQWQLILAADCRPPLYLGERNLVFNPVFGRFTHLPRCASSTGTRQAMAASLGASGRSAQPCTPQPLVSANDRAPPEHQLLNTSCQSRSSSGASVMTIKFRWHLGLSEPLGLTQARRRWRWECAVYNSGVQSPQTVSYRQQQWPVRASTMASMPWKTRWRSKRRTSWGTAGDAALWCDRSRLSGLFWETSTEGVQPRWDHSIGKKHCLYHEQSLQRQSRHRFSFVGFSAQLDVQKCFDIHVFQRSPANKRELSLVARILSAPANARSSQTALEGLCLSWSLSADCTPAEDILDLCTIRKPRTPFHCSRLRSRPQSTVPDCPLAGQTIRICVCVAATHFHPLAH